VTALVALVLTAAQPAMVQAGRRSRALLVAVGGAAVLIGVVAALALPKFTDDGPQPLSLVLHDDADSGKARWVAGSADVPLPPSFSGRGFERRPSYPWAIDSKAWVAAARSPRLAPPELAIESREVTDVGTRLRVRVRSRRGASIVGLQVEGWLLHRAWVDGVEVPLATTRTPFHTIEIVGAPPAGAVVDLLFQPSTATVFAYDVQPGLGAAGAELVRARPQWAVPIGRGDRTVVSRRFRLQAFVPPSELGPGIKD
jgi:hypothetical protein